MTTLTDGAPRTSDALPKARPMDLPSMTDGEVVNLLTMVREERMRVNDMLGGYEKSALSELERRIRERRKTNPDARAIPHPEYEITLVDEYTPYQADLEKLRSAKPMLPEDEGSKVIVHVKEAVQIIAAHDEAGNIATIKALGKKYGGTTLGDLLQTAISRVKTGEKLIVKPRKAGAA